MGGSFVANSAVDIGWRLDRLNISRFHWRVLALIAAGIVMLVQPWSIDLYGYSFVTILAGTLGFVAVSHFPE